MQEPFITLIMTRVDLKSQKALRELFWPGRAVSLPVTAVLQREMELSVTTGQAGDTEAIAISCCGLLGNGDDVQR